MQRLLTAKDIMNPHVITVGVDMTVQQLAGFLIEHEISGAPVVDESGKLVGVVSLTDIVQTASEGSGILQDTQPDFYVRGWEYKIERDETNQLHIENEGLPVGDIMTPTIFTVPEETSVSEIAKTMIAGRIHRLLVTDGNAVVGIITTLDMLKIIADHE